MQVEIAIPVLNEERTLKANVEIVLAALKNLFETPERIVLVIADNGSTDRTQAIGEQLAEDHPSVRYRRVPKPGVGTALKDAWLSSRADIVGYKDLDLATDLKHLPEAIKAIEVDGYDVCYGSRLNANSKVIGRKKSREFISHVFNIILKLYLGARFSDGMCGFKFLRRPLLERIIARGATSDGWFFSTELLLCAERLGLRVKELPVQWTDDPDSRVRFVPLTLQYLHAMSVLRARDKVMRHDTAQTLKFDGSE
jgi:glycosyltransferase involved in cell wall biosynthesis